VAATGGEAGDGGNDGPGADGSRSGRVVVNALGALAAAALVVGLVVVLSRDGGDDTASGTDEDPTTTTEPTTSTTASTTTVPTTTTVPVRAAVGFGGVFEVQLPAGWGSISVDGDMRGRGAEMFPDDPGHAEVANLIFDILLTPQTRFVAMDGNGGPSVTESDLLIVENGPAQVGLDAAFAAAKAATAAEPLAEGRVATPVGDAAWFDLAGPAGLRARRYVIVREDAAWLLTYWSADAENIGTAAAEVVTHLLPTAPI
jgi:hypothetical protein